jgi:tRNA pseudouridine38-40 synthase
MSLYKLEVEYIGTRYRGWQEQPNARTVQGAMLRAAETVLNERPELAGAGRTDAGVHALRQVAHLRGDGLRLKFCDRR